ncbi:MAG TPA: nucleotidyltransferase domain-containing protein, partial [Homoserinimonas sp.]|nr:nucleotidyltransferase domain-containing protein [Homoserinimonas sp.]
IFGSVARGEDTEGSDVDLLVSMPGEIGLLAITELSNEVSDVLGVRVEVIPEQLVKPEALYALAASAVAL